MDLSSLETSKLSAIVEAIVQIIVLLLPLVGSSVLGIDISGLTDGGTISLDDLGSLFG